MGSYYYKPQKIVVEESVSDCSFTTKILKKFSDIECVFVNNYDWKKKYKVTKSSNPLSKGKKILYLKPYQGKPVKMCPGFSNDLICCNYHVLDFIENCPLECKYCILQAIHNRPLITFHTNVEELLQKIAFTLEKRPQLLRIGTGEHSDSLALDHIFELNPYLVEFFGRFSNARLELKTKTNAIKPLLKLQHRGNTIISWSMSTQETSVKEELKTATAEERIAAASEVIDAGYNVAFHFDPLIWYEGWEDGYNDIIKKLFTTLPHKKILWISIGTLRYTPQLKKIAEERFPRTQLFSEEFIRGYDGKMRYIKPIREKLLSTIRKLIRNYSDDIPIYLCMENSSIWRNVMQEVPTVAEMEQEIQRNII